MKIHALALALCLVPLAASAIQPKSQPAEERARQQALPKSADPIWLTLAHTRVITDLEHGLFVAQHPADVRALDGKEVSITGFFLQTGIMSRTNRFILTRFTPVCPFCPPGAPNEAVDVVLEGFTNQRSGLVTVKGRLHLNSDSTTGLFFRLDQAAFSSGASG